MRRTEFERSVRQVRVGLHEGVQHDGGHTAGQLLCIPLVSRRGRNIQPRSPKSQAAGKSTKHRVPCSPRIKPELHKYP